MAENINNISMLADSAKLSDCCCFVCNILLGRATERTDRLPCKPLKHEGNKLMVMYLICILIKHLVTNVSRAHASKTSDLIHLSITSLCDLFYLQ